MFKTKDIIEDKFFSVSIKRVFINNKIYLLKKEVLVPEKMTSEDMLFSLYNSKPIAFRVNYVLSDPDMDNELVSIFELNRIDNCFTFSSKESLDQCYELSASNNCGCSIPYTEFKENFEKIVSIKNNSPKKPTLISVRGINGRGSIQESFLNQIIIDSEKQFSQEIYSEPGSIIFSHNHYVVSKSSDFIFLPPKQKNHYGLNIYSFCLK